MSSEARMGSHKVPIPTSTSSLAPIIHGLVGPIRRIVGARAAGMRRGGPLWSPVRCLVDAFGGLFYALRLRAQRTHQLAVLKAAIK